MTDYREELRTKILRTSLAEFQTKGIRAVRMDDIAGMLGISKRTLYEIYSNKEELLLEGIKIEEDEYNASMRTFADNAEHNVIDIIIEFYNCNIRNLTNISPVFFSEIRKYDKVVALLDQMHAERQKLAQDFFNRGVSEGLFREDVDYEIVTRIGNASMDYVMKTQMYNEFNLRYILHNVIFLFVRGICTEKGMRQIDKWTQMYEAVCWNEQTSDGIDASENGSGQNL